MSSKQQKDVCLEKEQKGFIWVFFLNKIYLIMFFNPVLDLLFWLSKLADEEK